MTFENYRAVGSRCAVDLDWFGCLGLDLRIILLGLQSCLGITPRKLCIVRLARQLVGRGTFQRRTREALAPLEVDCSSLMVYLYGQLGIDIPRLAIDQRDFGEPVDMYNVEAGDLLFTSGPYSYYDHDPGDDVGHVGLYTGQGTVIHAVNDEPAIREDRLRAFFDHERVARGAVRILPPSEKLLTLILPEDSEIRWSREVVRLLSTKMDLLEQLVEAQAKPLLLPVKPPYD